MELKDLNKFDMFFTTYGSCMAEIEEGKFYSVVDVEQLLNNRIILNLDQQKALMKLGLELIKLDGEHKNFNNARAISLIVEILEKS